MWMYLLHWECKFLCPSFLKWHVMLMLVVWVLGFCYNYFLNFCLKLFSKLLHKTSQIPCNPSLSVVPNHTLKHWHKQSSVNQTFYSKQNLHRRVPFLKDIETDKASCAEFKRNMKSLWFLDGLNDKASYIDHYSLWSTPLCPASTFWGRFSSYFAELPDVKQFISLIFDTTMSKVLILGVKFLLFFTHFRNIHHIRLKWTIRSLA